MVENMTKLCGGLIDYKEIHDSFYGVKSLVVQLDEIVHRYKTACDKTRFPFNYSDSLMNGPQIIASTPIRGRPKQCRLDFSNLSSISKVNATRQQPPQCRLDLQNLSTINKSNDDKDNIQTCENPECPYAPPPPCSVPSCPFRKQECEQQSEQKPKLPADNPNVCPNPECPYNEKDSEIVSQGTKCPNSDRPVNPCCLEATKDDCAAQSVCYDESQNSENSEESGEQELVTQTVYVSEDRDEVDTTPCRPATCFKHCGALECEQCLEVMESHGKSTKRHPMKFTKKPYEWTKDDRYPGYHIGHQYCCMPAFRVPPKQGWLWNIFLPCLSLKPRIGWRPGAVSRRLGALIRKRRRLYQKMLSGQQENETNEKMAGKRPNLYVVKKEGEYLVTMNCAEEPKLKPVQFKIQKNAREERSCYCGDDVDSDTSSDGFEFEFKAPTRIKQVVRKKPRKKVAKETQYNPSDFLPPKGKGKGKKGKDKKGKDKKKKKK